MDQRPFAFALVNGKWSFIAPKNSNLKLTQGSVRIVVESWIIEGQTFQLCRVLYSNARAVELKSKGVLPDLFVVTHSNDTVVLCVRKSALLGKLELLVCGTTPQLALLLDEADDLFAKLKAQLTNKRAPLTVEAKPELAALKQWQIAR